MTARAKELFDTSLDQVRRGQVRQALSTLLDALAADPVHTPSLDAAGRICRLLGAPEDADLFEHLAADPEAPEALHALGYRLVEQARPDVAVALLRRGLDDIREPMRRAAVRRELAYAQYLTRDFTGCLQTLAPLDGSLELSETERLDLLLLRAESALYGGRRDESEDALAEAEGMLADDGQRARLDALHGLLGRSRHWSRLTDLGLREWHFIQHAGVILKTAGGLFEDSGRSGRFDVLDLRIDMVAFLLQRLVDLFERLAAAPRVVIAAGELAAPMAHALALHWDAAVSDELEGRGSRRALLLAANAAELGPFSAELALHRSDLHVAALNLDWTRDAPVCPEIAGILAHRVFLPWEQRFALDPSTTRMHEDAGDERPPQLVARDILQAMHELPDDGGRSRGEFEAIYLPLAAELVLGNEDLHPLRRQFTQLSPCWKQPS